MDVTILEVHLPEAEFNAPFARGEAESSADAGPEVEEPSDTGSEGLAIAAVLTIVGLAVLSWLLRKSDGDDAGGTEER